MPKQYGKSKPINPKKRKNAETSVGVSSFPKKSRTSLEFDDISSADEVDIDEGEYDDEMSSDEEEEFSETADEKRLRLAKEYLAKIDAMKKRGGESDDDDEEEEERGEEGEDEDEVDRILRRDALEKKGRLHSKFALQLKDAKLDTPRIMRGHKVRIHSDF